MQVIQTGGTVAVASYPQVDESTLPEGYETAPDGTHPGALDKIPGDDGWCSAAHLAALKDLVVSDGSSDDGSSDDEDDETED